MVVAFATPTDLAAVIQRDVNTATALLDLELVAANIRNELGLTVDVATTTELLDGNGLPWLHLSQWPVTAISSVSEDGAALAEGSNGFSWKRHGQLGRWRGRAFISGPRAQDPTGFWSPGERNVSVLYTHGWAETEKEWLTCKRISLQVVGRAYINSGQHSAREIGQSRETFGAQGGQGRMELLETEKRDLDPLRKGV